MTTAKDERKDGGAAFARNGENCGQVASQDGMSLRDYFAAAALTGMLAADAHNDGADADVATWAYDYADAMLNHRSK